MKIHLLLILCVISILKIHSQEKKDYHYPNQSFKTLSLGDKTNATELTSKRYSKSTIRGLNANNADLKDVIKEKYNQKMLSSNLKNRTRLKPDLDLRTFQSSIEKVAIYSFTTPNIRHNRHNRIPKISLHKEKMAIRKRRKCANPLDQYRDLTKPMPFAPELAIRGNTYKGCFTNDFSQFYFFRKNNTSKYEDYRIYSSTFSEDNWQEPELISFSDTSSDVYPALSLIDANIIFFTSYRRTPNDTSKITNPNIWKSRKENDTWTSPVPLELTNLTYNYNAQPCMVNDGSIYFSSLSDNFRKNTTYKMEFVNGKYQRPVPFDFVNKLREEDPLLAYMELCVSPDENFMVLCASPKNVRDPKLYVAVKKNNEWTTPTYIGEIIKHDMSGGFPYITADNKFLLFTKDKSEFYILPTKTFIDY